MAGKIDGDTDADTDGDSIPDKHAVADAYRVSHLYAGAACAYVYADTDANPQ